MNVYVQPLTGIALSCAWFFVLAKNCVLRSIPQLVLRATGHRALLGSYLQPGLRRAVSRMRAACVPNTAPSPLMQRPRL